MSEDSSSYPDVEVASVLGRTPDYLQPESRPVEDSESGDQSHDQRQSTALTNFSRGNTATLTPNPLGQESAHQLAGQGELASLKHLLGNQHPDVVDTSGFTPLFWAAAYNQLHTVKYLIQNGSDPMHRGNHGETAVAIAASRGNDSILRFFVTECKCDINTVDDVGNSVLIHAVAGNHLESVRVLLQNGADLAHRNTDKLSAFDVALSCKHTEIQRELEKHMLDLLGGKM